MAKTIYIDVHVKTRYVGSLVEGTIPVYLEGDETDLQIEQACEDAAREWMFENIDWGFAPSDKS